MNIKFYYCLLLYLLMIGCPVEARDEGWIIKASSRENYNGVTLSNGRIGLVSGKELFSISDIVLNGVYDKESADGVSRIVRGPVFTNIHMYINGEQVSDLNTHNWAQILHMREAQITTSVDFSDQAHIDYTLLALRNLPFMGMVIVEITPHTDIEFTAANEPSFPDEIRECKTTYKILRDGEWKFPVFCTQATSRTGIHKLATCATFLFDEKRPELKSIVNTNTNQQQLTFTKRLKAGNKYRFALIGSICSTRDFSDESGESERLTVYAMQNSIDFHLSRHKAQWNELWKGDIVIDGNIEDQKDIRLALYHLYSFSRENTRLSIPPMGLSTVTGYNGHIFWDSELWMYPPLLMFNQEIARSLIDYRSDHLNKACQRAQMFGYRGAMYPWESDDSGEEATPTWCLTGPFEHHITADIGIAFWNYYRVCKDKEWLEKCGYPVLKNVADFWVSRVSLNPDKSYSIKNVVGADEIAQNIDDNAFTNGAAVVALKYAGLAAKELGVLPDKQWEKVGKGIRFLQMENGVTREHATYQGEIVKQADVNLLAYPLELITDLAQIKKDLAYYETRFHENGPAMSNAILAILYCRLGEPEKAYQLFKKSYIPNKRPPFGVLSESAFSNNPYFTTGAGGMLQAVINGFAGLKITESGITQGKSCLPSSWRSLTLKGIGPEKRTYIISQKP